MNFCPHCWQELVKSTTEGYAFQCADCDKDFVSFEIITENRTEINVKELLNKELSFEGMNELLNELMDYGCNAPADSSERFYVYDDEGYIYDFRKYIGMKALNTLSGILFLK